MDAIESKDVNVSSHIENAGDPAVKSGTLIVSKRPPDLGKLVWLALNL